MTRPAADTLRDGIHELRVRFANVNYRLLYGFHGQTVAVRAHGLVKTDVVPNANIDLAVERMRTFATNPETHTYTRRDREMPVSQEAIGHEQSHQRRRRDNGT